MTKFTLQFLIIMIFGVQSALANIQTINAIATGVATTTQVLVRGTDPNAPQPITVQPQQLQPIATAPPAAASQPSDAQQPASVAPSAVSPQTPTPDTQASSGSGTSTATSQTASTATATDSTSATPSASAPTATDPAPITSTPAPPPVNVTATTTIAPPAIGEIQSIEGIYAFGLSAEQELKVKIVIAPRSLGQGKTDLAQALEGVTAMVCIDKGNCQYAFPSKEGYFESVLKMPATMKAEEPQTHFVPIFVVACSSLGCVKSKVNAQVQFGT
jgi:hypothetical protein